MESQNRLQFSLGTFLFPLSFVFIMWLFFWVEVRFNYNLKFLGVYPLTVEGLLGVFFSPFVHSSLEHLFNNSIPLLVLMTGLFYFYRHIKWRVLLLGLVATGLLTWCIARPAYHIGASGIVYMLASFLFFKGIFSKNFQLIALSLVVVFLYGSLLWYLFPIDEKISWEGHLSGFIVGVVFSLLFRKNIVENKKYEWEKDNYDPSLDPFMQQFDDEGNFIEKPKEDEVENVPEIEKISKIKIQYIFKKKSKDEDL